MTKTIRYYPHNGGFNNRGGQLYTYTKSELLTAIQCQTVGWHKKRVTANDVYFDLIYDGKPDGDESSSFMNLIREIGFTKVYSVMLEGIMSIGYSDDIW